MESRNTRARRPRSYLMKKNSFLSERLLFSAAAVVFLSNTALEAAEPKNTPPWNQIARFFNPPPEFANDFGSYRSPLLFYDGRPVKSPADWLERRREILAKWTDLMGAWPPLIEKPKIEYLDNEKRDNFIQHRIRLEIAPQQIEQAYLLIPEGAGPFPAVVIPYYEPQSSIGRKEQLRDFGYQLTKRGFVTLSIGSPGGSAREPRTGQAPCQPLSFLAYVAANCLNALATLPQVDSKRIGVVGHSYGGKWAMFASCLYEKFACGVWSDGGIVFDEKRSNVNYWEPWYLGLDQDRTRVPGVPYEKNPRTGAYQKMIETGRDLHELHALMAPRPFLVSGGSEDRPERWRALNHTVAVNKLLGHTNRVAMTNREGHTPTPESNEQLYLFFEHFLKPAAAAVPK
jgi:dienelactone hydrolase